MKILNPNTGKEYVPILKSHLYVSITDFGLNRFLKEIKINPGQHTWEWISFRTDHFIDISGISDSYCSFDNAINKAVNDSYCTIYEFDDNKEMIKHWDDIKYIDSITTIYKSEDK